MTRLSPNEYGVYPDAERIEIDLPKKYKVRLEIRIAEGADGRFRWGCDYHYSHGGGGGLPRADGDSFGTKGEALWAAGEYLASRVNGFRQLTEKARRALIGAMWIFLGELRGEIEEAVDETPADDCGHGRPECPPGHRACPDCLDGDAATPEKPSFRTVPDRRRLRKGYLIGRDKYWIWRGHYTHDPSLSAWGMTEDIEDAYRFASLQECLEYWRSRHSFPEDYEHCIWDGYLTFWEETKKGIRRVMPSREQEELF